MSILIKFFKKRKIEEILKIVFGEIEYNEIKKFFYDIHENSKDVDVVVFTTRRSHLLYCLFREYFFFTKSKCKYMIDDKAVHYYSEIIYNKKCLIVDDILIHGRALKNVFDRISQKKPSEIKQLVYAKSRRAFNNKVDSLKDNLDDRDWELLSNKIVAALILTSTPYASYIFSFSKFMKYKQYKQLINDLKKVYKENEVINLELSETGNSSEINSIINKNIEGTIFNCTNNGVYKNLDFSCVRIYYNKILNKCTIVPFLIIPEMSEKEVNELCNSLFDKDLLITKNNCIEGKCRGITSILSYYIFKKLSNTSNKIKNFQWKCNYKDICMSYYERFWKEIKQTYRKINLETVKLNKNRYSNYDSYLVNGLREDNDVYKLGIEEIINDTNSKYYFNELKNISDDEKELIKNYLAYVSIKEEIILNNGCQEKQRGIAIPYLYNMLFTSFKGFSNFKFYSYLIECADTGLITIFIDSFYLNKEKNFSNFIITGEQVCRLFQNEYLIFVSDLEKIYKKKQTEDSCFKEYLEGSIVKLETEKQNNIMAAYDFFEKSNFKQYINKAMYKSINDKQLLFILVTKIGEAVDGF